MKELKLKLVAYDVYREEFEGTGLEECVDTFYYNEELAWEYIWEEVFVALDCMPPYEQKDKIFSVMNSHEVEEYMPNAGKYEVEDILAMSKEEYEKEFDKYLKNWNSEIKRYEVRKTTTLIPYDTVLENLVNTDKIMPEEEWVA